TQCTQPTGYVRVSGDCNDTDANIKPTTVWYQDSDGDGYGNSAVSLTQCAAPAGYVANADDCDDTKETIKPTTVWYADADGDGYGDEGVTKTQCAQPAGYIITAGDCDDSQEAINPATVWYADADGDGFGLEADKKTQCTKPEGYVLVSGDCDDAKADVNPNTVWYKDADGDGFGDAATTSKSCSKPEGFVADATDCNDADKDVYPSAPALPDGKDNNCDGSIDKLSQTITIAAIDNKTFGDAAFEVTATSSAGLAVALTVTGPATISGNVVTITGAGELVIDAAQAGNDGYTAADASVTIQVAKASQAISFTALQDVNLEEGTVTLEASSSSGLPITFSIEGAASVEGNTVTLLGAGPLTISASQPGNGNYNAATTATQSICVNPALPVITVASKGKSLSTSLVTGATYTWFRDGQKLPTEGNNLPNEDSGVFKVLVDVGGCTSTSAEVNVTITGINEAYLSNIIVYPNPATERISLKSLDEVFSSVKTVQISNVSGSLVKEVQLRVDENSIELADLPAGVYYLRVFDSKVRKDFRFIKQ
ncbi:MAG: MopE-related protein, partial [Imperialibacter sp.]